MAVTLLAFALFAAVAPPAAPSDSARATPAPAESTAAKPRIVRTFPAFEVRTLLPDMGASQVVHPISSTALRTFPVDDLAGLLGLQAGIVAQAEELHVRGGRAGELTVSLEGLSLNEPLRRRPMDVPLLALDRADLVSGAPDAEYGGGLAGVLDLHTVNPTRRPALDWRWQSDGHLDTHYDRIAARASSPLHAWGLGVVGAVDGTFDDTSNPMLRTVRRQSVAGIPLGWRAENRMLGFLKLAPVHAPERWSAQVVASRAVHEPYDPQWSLDGYTYISENFKDSPVFSPVPRDSFMRFRAADHLAITDDRQIAALVKVARLRETSRLGLSVGWLQTSTVTSVGGQREPESASHHPRYGSSRDRDRFYVLWGDYPLYRESDTHVLTVRGDGAMRTRRGASLGAGAGVTHDDVSMREMDWMPYGARSATIEGVTPLDSVRAYQATAPGAFAYAQGRVRSGGMILNLGMRAEYYTAGDAATRQTLPGSATGVWSLGPRLGIAYPISVRDAFSFAYVRMQQAPGRDFLYDQRVAISDRQPLGNPALVPSTVISYEAAVKHVFGPTLALQTSVFYRDVFDLVGALDYQIPGGTTNLRYANDDVSHVTGFECSLTHQDARRRIEASYTWMTATGNESRPEGDPYGPVREANIPSLGDQALSWDRRHALFVSGAWQTAANVTVAWSTAIASPLPWTPKERRVFSNDLSITNTRRLGWTELSNLDLRWAPPRAAGMTLGVEVRNLFDNRAERAATLDGYPNPIVNTVYDDYGAYRTETGNGGGAYWAETLQTAGHWVPVHDPRLATPPRAIRMSVGASW